MYESERGVTEIAYVVMYTNISIYKCIEDSFVIRQLSRKHGNRKQSSITACRLLASHTL